MPAACLFLIFLWFVKPQMWVGGGTQHFTSLAVSTAIDCTHMVPIKVYRRHVSNLEGEIGKTETAVAIGPPF